MKNKSHTFHDVRLGDRVRLLNDLGVDQGEIPITVMDANVIFLAGRQFSKDTGWQVCDLKEHQRWKILPLDALPRRYLVFAYQNYYPCGGWEDIQSSFHTLEEANDARLKLTDRYDTVEVIDSVTGREVFI